MKTIVTRSLLLSLLLLCGHAFAQSQATTTLPEWDKLTPQQREALIGPVRERWNNEPDERARMLERAQHWRDLSPEQRKQAHKGMRRFEGMNPEQREEARALFERMKQMPPEDRRKLREEWSKMTQEQRRAWVLKNQARRVPEPPPR
jgi:Spy/CpxP family protein refolding chaperone